MRYIYIRLDLFENVQPAASANMEANLVHSGGVCAGACKYVTGPPDDFHLFSVRTGGEGGVLAVLYGICTHVKYFLEVPY